MSAAELVPWLRALLGDDLEGWHSLEAVFLPRAGHEDRHLYARAREHAARCEAELAVLGEHAVTEWLVCCRACAGYYEPRADFPCQTVRLIGYGYRHRPGYREEWKP